MEEENGYYNRFFFGTIEEAVETRRRKSLGDEAVEFHTPYDGRIELVGSFSSAECFRGTRYDG